MNVITPIIGDPPVIKRIEQATDVDDQASFTDGVTQTRTWNVITNETDVELTVFDVVAQVPIFQPGYVIGTGAARRRLEDMRLRHTESRCIYTLECDFVPFEFKTPYLVPIEWSWETATIEIPTFSDAKGRPLVTTAGEPIVGLTRPLKCWILSGTRNIPSVPDWVEQYGTSVNKDRVTLDGHPFAPGKLQLQKMSIGTFETQTINGKEYRYRPLSFEFWFNPLGWQTELGNLGYVELQRNTFEETVTDPDTGEERVVRTNQVNQVRATDDGGEPTNNRVWLDKDGLRPRGEDGKPKKTLKQSELVFLKFDLLDELPYGPLLR